MNANPNLVRVGLLLVLGAVLINLGVAAYDVVVLNHGGLALLALLRASMSSAGLAILVVAMGQLRFEAAVAVEHARFLRQWLLETRKAA